MTEVKASKAKAQRRSPELDRFLRETRGAVVPLAAKCLLALRPSDGGPPTIETSQVYNFKAITIDCEDIREIEVWVLYQIGRAHESDGWKAAGTREDGRNVGFGDRVIGCFRDADAPIQQLVPEGTLSADEQRLAVLELVRALAGQLARLHKYCDQTKEWAQIERMCGEAPA